MSIGSVITWMFGVLNPTSAKLRTVTKDLASKTAAEKKMSAQTKKEQDAAEVVGTRFIKTESQADAHDRLRTYSEVSGKPLADVVSKHAEDYVKKTGRTGQGGVKIEFQKDRWV